MKNILVTGGAGFIGCHIARHHLEKGDRVWAVDNLQTGSLDNIAPYKNQKTFRFDQADLRDWDKMQEAVDWADRIYHMAAVIGQKKVLESPCETISSNIRCFEMLLDAISLAKKPVRLLLASTSGLYIHSKSTAEGTSPEDSMVSFPSGICLQETYPISKLVNEVMLLSYIKEKGIDGTIVRIFNTIGTNQCSHYGMVVPNFIEQALKGLPITVYGTGLQTRSFSNVHDTVRAFDLLLEVPESKGEIINVGNDREYSILNLAKLVLEKTQSKSKIVHLSYKEAYGIDFIDVQRRQPNLDKLRRLTGFESQWTLEQTIDEIIESYQHKTSSLK